MRHRFALRGRADAFAGLGAKVARHARSSYSAAHSDCARASGPLCAQRDEISAGIGVIHR
jgi:hypothetical protein